MEQRRTDQAHSRQQHGIGEPLASLPATAALVPVVQRAEPLPTAQPTDQAQQVTPELPAIRAVPVTEQAQPEIDLEKLVARLVEPVSQRLRPVDPLADLDMDKLARRLFEPLARMLRAEIRADRERAGRTHERRY